MYKGLLSVGLIISVLLSLKIAEASIDYRLGLKAGPVYTTFDYEDVLLPIMEEKLRIAFAGGPFLELNLNKHFAFVTGIRYIQYGNRLEFQGDLEVPSSPGLIEFALPDDVYIQGHFENILHYLAVQINLKIKPFHNLRAFTCFGPQVQYLLCAKDKYSIDIYSDSMSNEYNNISNEREIKDDLRDINLSFLFYIGYEFSLGKSTGIIEIGYSHSLLSNVSSGEWLDYHFRGFEMMIGLML